MNDDNDKNRYWTFLIYPESAPKDWKDILQQTFLPVAISPLHDKDLNADGEKKKPHYHIIVCRFRVNYKSPISIFFIIIVHKILLNFTIHNSL